MALQLDTVLRRKAPIQKVIFQQCGHLHGHAFGIAAMEWQAILNTEGARLHSFGDPVFSRRQTGRFPITFFAAHFPAVAFAADGDVSFTKVTTVEAGKEYLIVATSSSGYIYALANDSNIKMSVTPSATQLRCPQQMQRKLHGQPQPQPVKHLKKAI